MIPKSKTLPIIIMPFLGGAVLILGGMMLEETLPDWRLNNHTFHAVIEGLGAFAAITVAILLLVIKKVDFSQPINHGVACGLIGMGILDGIHAALDVGESFVWTHSLATFVGGTLFALVWFPQGKRSSRLKEWFPYIVAFAAIIIGTASILSSAYFPTMIDNGQFTPAARVLNILGGIGFLIAAAYFIFAPSSPKGIEQVIFSTLSFLFGIAGLLFEFSELWDTPWWLWHILRLAAYLAATLYIFTMFLSLVGRLKRRNDELTNKAVALAAEITKRQLTESALITAKTAAEDASIAKSEFLAIMSHELLTPLNAILGFSELIKMEAFGALGSEQYKTYASDIHSSGSHLLSLINDILYMAKVESGQKSLKIVSFDVNDLINDSIILIKDEAAICEIYLTNDVASDIPSNHGDYHAVKQCLINLLSNAVKFTPKQGTITISASAHPQWFFLSVTDTGIGIAKEDMDKLAQPFTQIERNKTQRFHEGTGIGLSITRNLIEMHGGRLEFDSEEGVGTTATIILPRGEILDQKNTPTNPFPLKNE